MYYNTIRRVSQTFSGLQGNHGRLLKQLRTDVRRSDGNKATAAAREINGNSNQQKGAAPVCYSPSI